LNRFKETLLKLLDRAREQAYIRLSALIVALEGRAVTVERGGKKTYRVRPAGESWFVSA